MHSIIKTEFLKRGASAAEYPAQKATEKYFRGRIVFFRMSLMTKLTPTLTLTDHHDNAKMLYSVSRSWIDEKIIIVSISWVVFRFSIAGKITFAVEFSAAEDLSIFKPVLKAVCL